jgi:hypothetical protein
MIAQVEYSVAGRSGDQVTLYVVCTVHEETMSTCFLVQLHNKGRRFVGGLTSKSLGWFSLIYPKNQWRQFSLV